MLPAKNAANEVMDRCVRTFDARYRGACPKQVPIPSKRQPPKFDSFVVFEVLHVTAPMLNSCIVNRKVGLLSQHTYIAVIILMCFRAIWYKDGMCIF